MGTDLQRGKGGGRSPHQRAIDRRRQLRIMRGPEARSSNRGVGDFPKKKLEMSFTCPAIYWRLRP